MKKLVPALFACLLALLTACAAQPGINVEPGADLVFVNDSDAVVVEVVANFEDRLEGSRRADNKPLKRGQTLGFEAGQYPVTVAVYDALFGNSGQKEVASLTISEAPPEGERWYIAAQDGSDGLKLSADTVWPSNSGGGEGGAK